MAVNDCRFSCAGGFDMKSLVYILGAIVFSFSAFAAGIDSRTYACTDLQSIIAARGFVFISQATFGDFAVANVSYCAGGNILELRSVTTSDRAECLINYCVSRSSGSLGGGM